MIYPIIMYGDPVLRQKAKEIDPGSDLKQLIDDMYETMHNASGIGLAAPQIGKSLRLFVVDGTIIDDEPGMADFKKVFINPLILEESGMPWDYEEGCLSIPVYRGLVPRSKEIWAEALLPNGEPVKLHVTGFVAIAHSTIRFVRCDREQGNG